MPDGNSYDVDVQNKILTPMIRTDCDVKLGNKLTLYYQNKSNSSKHVYNNEEVLTDLDMGILIY